MHGDATRAMKWVDGEVEAFSGIVSTREDYCACIGAHSAASLLEKAGCKHVKTIGEPDFEVSLDDGKNPLLEASKMGQKFFKCVFGVPGGRNYPSKQLKGTRRRFYLISILCFAIHWFNQLLMLPCLIGGEGPKGGCIN